MADSNWNRSINAIKDDVHRIKQNVGSDRSVIGFGHSMGGAMMYAAAGRSKATFDSIVMFDPPMFRPSIRLAMFILQRTGFMQFYPLVRAARKRPAVFKSRHAAEAYIASRRLYKSFHPEILELLMAKGVVDDGFGAARFLFTPEEEVSFYNTTPTDIQLDMLGEEWIGQYEPANCPAKFLFGSRYDFNSEANIKYLKQTLQTNSRSKSGSPTSCPIEFEGKDVTHFHPLVDPRSVARWITEFALKSVTKPNTSTS
jgi:pimeloyl-ACP methyl ester carboxylesterase